MKAFCHWNNFSTWTLYLISCKWIININKNMGHVHKLSIILLSLHPHFTILLQIHKFVEFLFYFIQTLVWLILSSVPVVDRTTKQK